MRIAQRIVTGVVAAVLSVGLLGSTLATPAAADTSWGKGVAIPR